MRFGERVEIEEKREDKTNYGMVVDKKEERDGREGVGKVWMMEKRKGNERGEEAGRRRGQAGGQGAVCVAAGHSPGLATVR